MPVGSVALREPPGRRIELDDPRRLEQAERVQPGVEVAAAAVGVDQRPHARRRLRRDRRHRHDAGPHRARIARRDLLRRDRLRTAVARLAVAPAIAAGRRAGRFALGTSLGRHRAPAVAVTRPRTVTRPGTVAGTGAIGQQRTPARIDGVRLLQEAVGDLIEEAERAAQLEEVAHHGRHDSADAARDPSTRTARIAFHPRTRATGRAKSRQRARHRGLAHGETHHFTKACWSCSASGPTSFPSC